VKRQVQLIDLLPTMLDFSGIPPDTEVQGHSLLPLVTGTGEGASKTYSFSESRFDCKVVRSAGWKLIENSYDTELYDPAKNPGEKNDLAGARKDTVAELEAVLSNRLAAEAALGYGEALPGKEGEYKAKDAAFKKEL
jgi:arylsulfatase A-like enzyme